MKRIIHYLTLTTLALALSSCSVNEKNDTAVSALTTTFLSSETTASTTETVTENEMSSKNTNNGFVFYDYTGEMADNQNVSSYTLDYAIGWQAFDESTLCKIDNKTTINGMAITDVYSEYSVFQAIDGYVVNYSEGGYSLVSEKDAFEGVNVKSILKNNGTDWILKIIKEDADEYFFDISVGGSFKAEETKANSIVSVGEQIFNVQPMEIIIRNADEFVQIKNLDANSVYMAELTLEAIVFNAYAQDAADSPATHLTTVAYLKSVETVEII